MEQNKLLDIEIITPQKVVFSGKAVSVSLPGTESAFQVLNRHAPIVSTLETGIVRVNDENDKELFFATSDGFTEVRSNHVAVMVETAFDAHSIDIQQATNEISEAKEILKHTKIEDEVIDLKKTILMAENRIKAANKQKE